MEPKVGAACRLLMIQQKVQQRCITKAFYHWHCQKTQQALSSANLTLEAVSKHLVKTIDDYTRLRAAKSIDFLAKTVESNIRGIPVSKSMITVAFDAFVERVRESFYCYARRSRQDGRISLSDLQSFIREYQLFSADVDVSLMGSNNEVDFSFPEFVQGITNLLSLTNYNCDELESLRASELVWKRIYSARVPRTAPLPDDSTKRWQDQMEILNVLERETKCVEQQVMIKPVATLLAHILCGYEEELTTIFYRYAVASKVHQKQLMLFFHEFGLVPHVLNHAKALQLYREAKNNQPLEYADFLDVLCECARQASPEQNLSMREMVLTLLFHIGVKKDEICFLSTENETVLWALFQHYATRDKNNQLIMTGNTFNSFVADIIGKSSIGLDEHEVGFEGFCVQLAKLDDKVEDTQQIFPLGERVARWMLRLQAQHPET